MQCRTKPSIAMYAILAVAGLVRLLSIRLSVYVVTAFIVVVWDSPGLWVKSLLGLFLLIRIGTLSICLYMIVTGMSKLTWQSW